MKTYQEFVNENSKYTKHVKAIQNWNDKADVRGMIKQIPLNRKNFQKKESVLYNIEGIDFTKDKEKIIQFKKEIEFLIPNRLISDANLLIDVKLKIQQFEKEVKDAEYLNFIKRIKMSIRSFEILNNK